MIELRRSSNIWMRQLLSWTTWIVPFRLTKSTLMSVGLSIRSEIATHTVQAVSDDILYIQSQNRGLQVQTQNLRALLGEIENLLVRPSVVTQNLGSLMPAIANGQRLARSVSDADSGITRKGQKY